jgi:membrane-associated phospholipid phosphatase
MIKMTEILDYIGYHGPVIHIAISFCLLWNYKTYLIAYLLGLIIINHWSIIWLKGAIAEPRPDGWRKIQYIDSELLEKGNLVYGMPSGHSQTLF